MSMIRALRGTLPSVATETIRPRSQTTTARGRRRSGRIAVPSTNARTGMNGSGLQIYCVREKTSQWRAKEGSGAFVFAFLKIALPSAGPDLLRDLLRIEASNGHCGPCPTLPEMRFSRDWRTIGTL